MPALKNAPQSFDDTVIRMSKSMKALVFAKPGVVELREKPIPDARARGRRVHRGARHAGDV